MSRIKPVLSLPIWMDESIFSRLHTTWLIVIYAFLVVHSNCLRRSCARGRSCLNKILTKSRTIWNIWRRISVRIIACKTAEKGTTTKIIETFDNAKTNYLSYLIIYIEGIYKKSQNMIQLSPEHSDSRDKNHEVLNVGDALIVDQLQARQCFLRHQHMVPFSLRAKHFAKRRSNLPYQ